MEKIAEFKIKQITHLQNFEIKIQLSIELAKVLNIASSK